ncbi:MULTISPECIES: lipocalin-like domain-containing protein [unclassified Ensifer]|uniref:lipocalin-like domain-containing protein n=1 Tax=unclassified Ensifer TaxID=2633371 RepID=UPI00087ECABC|nr:MULTISPECIES: lipocalin-like domain-containing protein [unclassified Ensifer]MBD9596307.1 iron ABC transporter permease [Ensifer sp. ENS05]SDN18287.1 Predicted secreted hydrolase [Ensifer sp. YR511]
MNGRRTFLTILAVFLLFPVSLLAQGFAGLGSNAEGFAVPQKGALLEFPRDHGAHPDFRIEWWYVTANLETTDGWKIGVQWTLFRSALAPVERQGWTSPQVWIGHAAVTTADRHYVGERLARGGVGQAGVSNAPFEAWIDDWQMKGRSTAPDDELNHLDLTAKDADFAYRLALDAQGPLVLQGDRGFSVKSAAGQASYYYSQPFYMVRGRVELGGESHEVTGKAWLDREWSSQPLASDQTGWDWFSLQLASGERVMAFRLRDGGKGYVSANWIEADGKTSPLGSQDVSLEPLRLADVEGKSVPVEWRVRIASRGLDVRATALNDHAWMATSTPYWEGPIQIDGSTTGQGYLEMTGY